MASTASSNGVADISEIPEIAEPEVAPKAKPAKKPGGKKSAKRKTGGAKRKAKSTGSRTTVVKRTARSFPASPFEEALAIGDAIQEFGGGHRQIRRLTLFEQLGRSPESSPSRKMVTSSGQYGITKGSFSAEFLELTDDGAAATDPDNSVRDRLRARYRLSIEGIVPFKSLYEVFSGNKLPAQQVMKDHLEATGMPPKNAAEAVELFIVNAKFLGLLRPMAGTERILTLEHALDGMPATPVAEELTRPVTSGFGAAKVATSAANWSTTCFYISPIGDEGGEHRKHADVLLGHVVEPAIDALERSFTVIRADQIDKPGLITAQVIDHIMNAALVVADLSFHNPNVFYELALRHATGKPTVQIRRADDAIPFDVSDVRTVTVDTTDIHSFVTQMETWRAQLTNYARQALDHPDDAANPLVQFGVGLQSLAQAHSWGDSVFLAEA